MNEMRQIIYIKADRNTEVIKPEVRVGDVMEIECADKKIASCVKNLRLLEFHDIENKGKDRVTISVLKVIACIHKAYPKAEIQNMGETDFIVTYEKQKTPNSFMHFLKAALVVVISFTGAAFSIMTFNNDVDVTNVFAQIYELMTGIESDGFTIIELTYSIGLVIGILVFFNHFGKKRFTVDPTPMEVEMRLYENDLQTTIIENSSRKEQELDADH